MDSTAPGSAPKLRTLWILMIKFRGLGYNTKRIHNINTNGKYFRNTFFETFSEPSRPFIIAVDSVELLIIFFSLGTA
jgi:hypothetical protein